RDRGDGDRAFDRGTIKVVERKVALSAEEEIDDVTGRIGEGEPGRVQERRARQIENIVISNIDHIAAAVGHETTTGAAAKQTRNRLAIVKSGDPGDVQAKWTVQTVRRVHGAHGQGATRHDYVGKVSKYKIDAVGTRRTMHEPQARGAEDKRH